MRVGDLANPTGLFNTHVVPAAVNTVCLHGQTIKTFVLNQIYLLRIEQSLVIKLN